MLGIYSFLLTIAMFLLSPLFLLRRQKYASGFSERLGNYPPFKQNGRKVIWLHCVSVGETNAARPLVGKLQEEFPDHRLVISTTTRTGQELAQKIFKDKADAVFYLPFDWKFSVRRALRNFQPSTILLMETEIWPRLINEAKRSGAKISIVNGRLSEKSFHRYSRVRGFVHRVLENIDLALMQNEKDAERIEALGIGATKVKVTGNLKFDLSFDKNETALTNQFRERFGIDGTRPIIVAASTHESEEELIFGDFVSFSASHPKIKPRLIIAPRHPERFNDVAAMLDSTVNKDQDIYDPRFARRSALSSETDKFVNVILLDSVGELRSILPLANIVFVGGSLIPHGGQSILEPAAAAKAIITGPYTHNFEAVTREFLLNDGLIQLRIDPIESLAEQFYDAIDDLLTDPIKQDALGSAALDVMKANRGATEKTIVYLRSSNVLSN
jgi:3-deoxy-D-manno-octulosonic-acid transferase